MSETKKVWPVLTEWHSNDACMGNWYNNDSSALAAVFSSEENAVNYVLRQLANILEAKHKYNEPLFSMPSKDDVYLQHGFEWTDEFGHIIAYVITEYDIDQPNTGRESTCSTF